MTILFRPLAVPFTDAGVYRDFSKNTLIGVSAGRNTPATGSSTTACGVGVAHSF